MEVIIEAGGANFPEGALGRCKVWLIYFYFKNVMATIAD